MILKMYSVYDRKTEIHHPPAFCHNTGHALRFFTDVFTSPDNVFGKHAEDYQIFEIGTFNDEDAKLTACTPHLITSGAELMTKFVTQED